MRILTPIPFLLALALSFAAVAAETGAKPSGDGPRILCTTFPICQITRNVAAGRVGARVDLLIPAAAGCPHDYALTPREMAMLASADILVTNGLGMEEFLGPTLEQINPRLRMVDSSAGIGEIIDLPAGGHHHDDESGSAHTDGGGGEGEEGEEGPNPHLYVSPAMSARLALNIAGDLSRLDPAGAATYTANAGRYAERMRVLFEEMRRAAAKWPNRRVVEPHGVFDYLARDLGLEIVGVMQPHGEELAAAQLLALVRNVGAAKPAAIFLEPQYSAKVGETLSRETGVPAYLLDPASSGPDNAPLDYYEQVMRRDLAVLEKALGE